MALNQCSAVRSEWVNCLYQRPLARAPLHDRSRFSLQHARQDPACVPPAAQGDGARCTRVSVCGPQAVLRELDKALWSFSAVDFVAHCLADSPAELLSASPVVLGMAVNGAPHHDVLLNLDAEVPAGFERYSRVIEVVGSDAQERAQSRMRWKYYQQRGYPIVQHDLAPKESD